jgi:hypothetical protein
MDHLLLGFSNQMCIHAFAKRWWCSASSAGVAIWFSLSQQPAYCSAISAYLQFSFMRVVCSGARCCRLQAISSLPLLHWQPQGVTQSALMHTATQRAFASRMSNAQNGSLREIRSK